MPIDSREQLIHVLTEAAEIEHNLLCSYLYAVFSLKREGEGGLSPKQAEAVESWRRTILKIALEEMAHLASVNNLLLAVGGAPHFDRPNFPVAPGYHPADLVVRLTPFNDATLDHFIFLERPDDMEMEDGAGFVGRGSERVTPGAGLTPSAEDYLTVGALYDSLAEGFRSLAARLGEAVLIDPHGTAQLSSEAIKLPNIESVTSLATALATIAQIKEEGEGSTSPDADSHFRRFTAIKREWADLRADDPGFEPAWPAAHDPVMRKPLDEGKRVWVTDERAARYLDLANATYGMMLSVLSQSFASSAEAEKPVLMRLSVELMEASAAISTALARMPASPEWPGVNAGMTFTVPRNSAFRPTAVNRAAIFLERLHELRAGAEAALVEQAREKAMRRLGNAIELAEGLCDAGRRAMTPG